MPVRASEKGLVISLRVPGGLKSNTVRLSLLIKQKEKEQQREHRMRKEAEGRHKQRTIEDLKGNGFVL